MNELSKVAKNILLAMEIANIKESELAKVTHISQSSLNAILTGRTKFPRVDTLQLIAGKLGVTVAQLADEDSLPIRDFEKIKQHFAPIIEWSEILNFLKDKNYCCLNKKILAINVKDEEASCRRFALTTSPSMEPQFRRGAHIIVEPTRVYKDHQVAVVSFDGNEPVLRRIIKDGSDLYLQKLNFVQGGSNVKVTDLDTLLGRVISEIRFEEDFWL